MDDKERKKSREDGRVGGGKKRGKGVEREKEEEEQGKVEGKNLQRLEGRSGKRMTEKGEGKLRIDS